VPTFNSDTIAPLSNGILSTPVTPPANNLHALHTGEAQSSQRKTVKPAELIPLYKDTPELYKILNVPPKDLSRMRTYREYIAALCLGKGYELTIPYEQHGRPEMLRLSKYVTDRCNKKFGLTSTFTVEAVDALIHRICLDKKRNAGQKTRRRNAELSSTVEPDSEMMTLVCTLTSLLKSKLLLMLTFVGSTCICFF
jgi:hypothetical protein